MWLLMAFVFFNLKTKIKDRDNLSDNVFLLYFFTKAKDILF